MTKIRYLHSFIRFDSISNRCNQGSKSEAKTPRLGRLRLEIFFSAKVREVKAGENLLSKVRLGQVFAFLGGKAEKAEKPVKARFSPKGGKKGGKGGKKRKKRRKRRRTRFIISLKILFFNASITKYKRSATVSSSFLLFLDFNDARAQIQYRIKIFLILFINLIGLSLNDHSSC